MQKGKRIDQENGRGASLKRWQREKWVNTKTGRPCGNNKDKTEYCRPTKKVSKETPKTRSSMSKRTRPRGTAKSKGRGPRKREMCI